MNLYHMDIKKCNIYVIELIKRIKSKNIVTVFFVNNLFVISLQRKAVKISINTTS